VAFVIGDVVGHGLRATATMGRLRTAVQALADLDMPPDELLTHLDGLVTHLRRSPGYAPEEELAGTCLYAVYDALTGRCTMASAGHAPPMLVRPDGTVESVDVAPGPPLGVGGLPFEVTEIDVPPGSILALYTDGLVEDGGDVASGLEELRAGLAPLHRTDVDLAEAADELVRRIAPASPEDDIALLLARTRIAADENVVSWTIPGEPAAVAHARDLAARQLAEWGLAEIAFTTGLVISELVTNAVRYAGGPIQLRLIRDRVLVCEVSDRSSSQPRRRRAHATDEGGRGLFLVAQLTTRWGSRYTETGKTIWTEQSLDEPLSF
jgi:signal transduction histidine kinase